MKKKFAAFAVYIFAVMAATAVFSYFIVDIGRDVFALGKQGGDVGITVPEGADTKTVAVILKKAGAIKFPAIFRVYSKLRGDDGKYLSGTFMVDTSSCYDTLRRALKPSASARSQIKLTFPEGSDVDDIIDIFVSAGIGTREKFVSVINTFDFGFDFLPEQQGNRIYRLEGYLFPDTYMFYSDSSETEALYKMLSNFDRKLSAEIKSEAQRRGMTVDELITLASIIEKEAYFKSDQALISAVFHNRLKSKTLVRLESDATAVYARDAGKATRGGVPTSEDLSAVSPYNTYKTVGLPPGAICSPGLDAIEAAAIPASADYLYFVCNKDKKAVFSRTYTEHLRAVEKAKNG